MPVSYTQVQHISKNIHQRLFKVPVGIIGGYHGGNLGDIALGESVKEQLKAKKIRSGLETLYNLEKWPKTPYAIVGGGAVGYIDSLRRVIKRYDGEYNRVGILGVDFNEKEYPKDCLQLIQNAAFVSGRSEKQAGYLKAITGRKEIYSHPDIAFSLESAFCRTQREMEKSKESKQKKLLVNVVPLYANLKNGRIVPTENYKSERPELYEKFDEMHASYKIFIRENVAKALSEGYKVETIPFTPADREYARMLLSDMPVAHPAYHSDPGRMIRKMAEADWVIATRFHATIFALKLGIKLSPVAYATKNELMLQSLGLNRNLFLSSSDLAMGNASLLLPVRVEAGRIDEWEQASEKAIQNCIEALRIKR